MKIYIFFLYIIILSLNSGPKELFKKTNKLYLIKFVICPRSNIGFLVFSQKKNILHNNKKYKKILFNFFKTLMEINNFYHTIKGLDACLKKSYKKHVENTLINENNRSTNSKKKIFSYFLDPDNYKDIEITLTERLNLSNENVSNNIEFFIFLKTIEYYLGFPFKIKNKKIVVKKSIKRIFNRKLFLK